ncbi:hypothetical protein [Burkholderia multivorans]|uniref:hypothetical protein n=1 Tax=Burkholderia multivorans TaxID=87883 RepID=UPI000D00DF72|nr:hypothetical protein [Burkholderia multivorans]PRH14295.1 hypothetical protein C6T56_27080 [Burkholderia multivorans]
MAGVEKEQSETHATAEASKPELAASATVSGEAEAGLSKDKVESAIAKLTGGADLSQDDVPSPQADNIALEESNHRRRLQNHLFYWGMGFVGVLFLAAIVFAGAIVCRYWRSSGDGAVDWHVSAIVGAFVIPPTVVLIALIRAIYEKSENKEAGDSLPALNLIKDILIAVKEAAKAVKP